MNKLEKVKAKARSLGIKDKINYSTHKNKKFMITVSDKAIHFGQDGYKDFLDHGDLEKRANYLARASKIKKNGKLSINDPNSANYYAIRLLW